MNPLFDQPSDVLTAALPLAGLVLGLLIGVLLNASHHRRKRKRGAPLEDAEAYRALQLELGLDDKIGQMHAAEVEIAQVEMRLTHLNKTIASTRQQLDETEQEYDRLLVEFDQSQSSVEQTNSNLNAIRQSLEARSADRSKLLSEVDQHIEELDMLKQMQDGYDVKINRLTQQVQWQDSELRMLRQTVKAKTAEIDEARGLLDQRDAELRMLHRQRQQREIDIAHARQLIAEKDSELRHKMSVASAFDSLPLDRPAAQMGSGQGAPPASHASAPPPPIPALPSNETMRSDILKSASRVDVTPREQPIPASTQVIERVARPVAAPDEPDDDLTVLPRLTPFYASQLRQQGIRTIRQLAEMEAQQVRLLLDPPPHHEPECEKWVNAAKKLTRRRRKPEPE
jgi:predicted flap endonuclease-1-like 5' DNA nuclease